MIVEAGWTHLKCVWLARTLYNELNLLSTGRIASSGVSQLCSDGINIQTGVILFESHPAHSDYLR